MAVITQGSGGKGTGGLEKYLKQKTKTEKKLQTGIHCNIRDFSKDFDTTRKLYEKNGVGRQYYHIVQSFSPEDNISNKKTHELGVKLAKEKFGSKGFEVAVITHKDTKHPHNHIVVNSVNLETGKKYKSRGKDYRELKDINDKLCKENNLIIPKRGLKKKKHISRGQLESIKRKKSWTVDIALAIRDNLKKSTNIKEFEKAMDLSGYKMNYRTKSGGMRKYITYESKEEPEKKIRGKTLNKKFQDYDFSKAAILLQLQQHLKKAREKKSGRKKKWDKLIKSQDLKLREVRREIKEIKENVKIAVGKIDLEKVEKAFKNKSLSKKKIEKLKNRSPKFKKFLLNLEEQEKLKKNIQGIKKSSKNKEKSRSFEKWKRSFEEKEKTKNRSRGRGR